MSGYAWSNLYAQLKRREILFDPVFVGIKINCIRLEIQPLSCKYRLCVTAA